MYDTGNEKRVKNKWEVEQKLKIQTELGFC